MDWQTEAERLREALGRVEALAHAADVAAAELPTGRTQLERRAIRRVIVLVRAAEKAAGTALR